MCADGGHEVEADTVYVLVWMHTGFDHGVPGLKRGNNEMIAGKGDLEINEASKSGSIWDTHLRGNLNHVSSDVLLVWQTLTRCRAISLRG